MTQPYPPMFVPVDGPWRHKTAKYAQGPGIERGWYQDDRKLRHVKASKAFIWPKDGKNGTTWGRIKDVLQNKGPDIYVAFGARKGDCVSNRPTRAQWAQQTFELADRGETYGFNSKKYSPFGGRTSGLSYDFRTRKYRPPYGAMWTDAVWQQESYKNRKWNPYPEAVQFLDGQWWQDPQYLPNRWGGPLSNEFGPGLYGTHRIVSFR